MIKKKQKLNSKVSLYQWTSESIKMATSSSKLGTPVNTFTAPTPPAPPPTVIPTSCLAQQEQRWFLVSLVGLLEVRLVD